MNTFKRLLKAVAITAFIVFIGWFSITIAKKFEYGIAYDLIGMLFIFIFMVIEVELRD